MATRASTRSARASKTNAAPQQQPDIEVELGKDAKFVGSDERKDHAEARSEAWERFRAAQEGLAQAFGVPSGTRLLLGYVSSIIVSSGLAYVGGTLLGMLAEAAIIATGWQFIGFVVLVLGSLLLIAASVTAGGYVFELVTTDKLSRGVSTAKSWVSGLFVRNPIVEG